MAGRQRIFTSLWWPHDSPLSRLRITLRTTIVNFRVCMVFHAEKPMFGMDGLDESEVSLGPVHHYGWTGADRSNGPPIPNTEKDSARFLLLYTHTQYNFSKTSAQLELAKMDLGGHYRKGAAVVSERVHPRTNLLSSGGR